MTEQVQQSNSPWWVKLIKMAAPFAVMLGTLPFQQKSFGKIHELFPNATEFQTSTMMWLFYIVYFLLSVWSLYKVDIWYFPEVEKLRFYTYLGAFMKKFIRFGVTEIIIIMFVVQIILPKGKFNFLLTTPLSYLVEEPKEFDIISIKKASSIYWGTILSIPKDTFRTFTFKGYNSTNQIIDTSLNIVPLNNYRVYHGDVFQRFESFNNSTQKILGDCENEPNSTFCKDSIEALQDRSELIDRSQIRGKVFFNFSNEVTFWGIFNLIYYIFTYFFLFSLFKNYLLKRNAEQCEKEFLIEDATIYYYLLTKSILAWNPHKYYLKIGDYFFSQGNYLASYRMYDLAVELKSKSVEAKEKKGGSLVMLELYADAISCYLDILPKMKTDKKRVQKKIADCHFNNDDYQEALTFYLDYHQLHPNDDQIAFNIAVCYYFLDNQEKAESFFLKIQDLDLMAKSCIFLGHQKLKSEGLDEALAYYLKSFIAWDKDLDLLKAALNQQFPFVEKENETHVTAEMVIEKIMQKSEETL